MPQTPDRTPGPADEEELILEDRTADGAPVIDGAIRYYNNDIVGKIPTGVFSLTQQGGGSLPPATQVGQVLYSPDGITFTVQQPLVSCNGWMVNDSCVLLVVG